MFNNFRLLLLMVFVFSIQNVEAQKNQLDATITVGWAIPILDGGAGYHVGINPNFNFSNFFAIESQFSYAFANIDKFIIGDPAKAHSTNGLIGGRIYVFEEGRKFRPYLNLLGGVLYYFEKDETTQVNSSFFSLGLSAGLYLQIQNKFTVGIAGETSAFLVVKAGYNL